MQRVSGWKLLGSQSRGESARIGEIWFSGPGNRGGGVKHAGRFATARRCLPGSVRGGRRKAHSAYFPPAGVFGPQAVKADGVQGVLFALATLYFADPSGEIKFDNPTVSTRPRRHCAFDK
jgi:hypothetical protein